MSLGEQNRAVCLMYAVIQQLNASSDLRKGRERKQAVSSAYSPYCHENRRLFKRFQLMVRGVNNKDIEHCSIVQFDTIFGEWELKTL